MSAEADAAAPSHAPTADLTATPAAAATVTVVPAAARNAVETAERAAAPNRAATAAATSHKPAKPTCVRKHHKSMCALGPETPMAAMACSTMQSTDVGCELIAWCGSGGGWEGRMIMLNITMKRMMTVLMIPSKTSMITITLMAMQCGGGRKGGGK